MTIHDNNQNGPRPTVTPTPANPYGTRTPAAPDRNIMSGYAIPATIAAVAIIAGVYFMMPNNDRNTTASNSAPVSRQVNPGNTTSPSSPTTTTPAPTTVPAPTKIQ